MRKNNSNGIVSGISAFSGLPFDMLGNCPIFHLYSNNEIVIEGAKAIEYYDEGTVRISANKCSVNVRGNNLCIKCLMNGNLAVRGIICSVDMDYRQG